MKLRVRFAMLVLGALLLTGQAMAQPVPLDDNILGVAGGDYRPLPEPMFAMTEDQTNLSGYSSDVTLDTGNVCFNGASENLFFSGESVALNVLFEDTVESDQFNEYTVTWALRKQGNIVPAGTFSCSYDLSAFAPGDVVSLCCYIIEVVPTPPVPIPIQINVDWGARVVKDESGFTTQGILGNATVRSF